MLCLQCSFWDVFVGPTRAHLPTLLPLDRNGKEECGRVAYYIFLKQCCRWRPWGLLCLYHGGDQHMLRTTDTCTQHTCGLTIHWQTDVVARKPSGVWMPLYERRERERALVWYVLGSPSTSIFFFSPLFYFLFRLTWRAFYVAVWTKKINFGSLHCPPDAWKVCIESFLVVIAFELDGWSSVFLFRYTHLLLLAAVSLAG